MVVGRIRRCRCHELSWGYSSRNPSFLSWRQHHYLILFFLPIFRSHLSRADNFPPQIMKRTESLYYSNSCIVSCSRYNHVQKLLRKPWKNGVLPVNHKQLKTLLRDHMVKLKIISLYKGLKTQDLRSSESRNHYHEVGNLVPSPRCSFSFKVAFQLWGLKLTLSVYIRNATFPVKVIDFSHYFLHMIVEDCGKSVKTYKILVRTWDDFFVQRHPNLQNISNMNWKQWKHCLSCLQFLIVSHYMLILSWIKR